MLQIVQYNVIHNNTHNNRSAQAVENANILMARILVPYRTQNITSAI